MGNAHSAGALSGSLGSGPAQLEAFPNIAALDLRRTSISPFQLRQLAAALAPGVRLLRLTYLERIGRPHQYFDQLDVGRERTIILGGSVLGGSEEIDVSSTLDMQMACQVHQLFMSTVRSRTLSDSGL